VNMSHAAPRVLKVPLGPSRWHLQAGSVDLLLEDASFEPGARGGSASASNELRAPFNGKVIEVKAQPGASVVRGDTLLVIESMKLEHSLAAARDGVVKSVHVAAGQQTATSQVLVTFEAAAA
jgi:geranyl-CoA carboxylase alpha subunit